MSFTTESLLESAVAGFGIETLSPLQRAKARILDGRPLGELASREDVRRLLGCDPSALPPVRPVEVVDVCGIRTLKTTGCAAKCIELSQSVDVSPVRHGEVPHIFWLSTTTDKAKPGFNLLVQTILSRRALRPLVVGDPTADSITLRHPSGVPIRIVIVPASRAGATLVGVWCAGAVFDEAARWQSTDEGHVVTLEDCRTAVRGRLLPGAQLFYPGSPWAPEGFVYQTFTDRHGSPGADLAVLHADARSLWPDWWTPERCAEVKKASPRTFAMDIEARFGATDSSAYDLADVEAAGQPRIGASYIGERILLVDPSKLLGSDAWAAMVVSWRRPAEQFIPRMVVGPGGEQLGPARDEWQRPIIDKIDARPYLSVDHAVAWRDRPQWDELVSRIRAIHDAFGFARGFGDYGGDTRALESAILKMGAQFTAFPMNSAPRRAAYEWLGRLLADRAIHIPQADVRADLLRVQTRLQPGGELKFFARRNANGHADLASCLVAYGMAEVSGELWSTPHTLAGPRHIADPR